jgi:hypothetical protein
MKHPRSTTLVVDWFSFWVKAHTRDNFRMPGRSHPSGPPVRVYHPFTSHSLDEHRLNQAVVVSTKQRHITEPGRPTFNPRHQMMHLATFNRHPTPRETTPTITLFNRAT